MQTPKEKLRCQQSRHNSQEYAEEHWRLKQQNDNFTFKVKEGTVAIDTVYSASLV